MVRLGKRKEAKKATEKEEMHEEIIGSPSKALFGDDPHEQPKVMDELPKFLVDVCYLKDEADNFKVLISKDYIYSKQLKKREGKKEVVVYLQLLMMKQNLENFYLFKCRVAEKEKPQQEIKNFGNDYKKAQLNFMDSYRELVGNSFVEQYIEFGVSRGLNSDQIDKEISAEIKTHEDKPLGILAKNMFNLKSLEQGLKAEGINLALLKDRTVDESEKSLSSAFNILLRIKESLDTPKYSDVIGASIEGLSMKFFEKIPHNVDLLELRKYNINSEERVKTKVTLLRLIQTYEELYRMHARLREAFDFNSENSIQQYFLQQLGGFSLESLSNSDDRDGILRYINSGIYSQKLDVGDIFVVRKSNQTGLNPDQQFQGRTETLWTAIRIECLVKQFRQDFLPSDFIEEEHGLLVEGASTCFFDSSEAAIGSLKRNSSLNNLVLVLCEVLRSETSPVVHTELELKDVMKEIKKADINVLHKTKPSERKNYPPTIIEGRNKIDFSQSQLLQSHNIRVPVGSLVSSDSIVSEYLFCKTIVHSSGWISPKYIVRLKSAY